MNISKSGKEYILNNNQDKFIDSFKKRYPYKKLRIDGKDWYYLDTCKKNSPILVLLHGGFSNAYFYFHQIPEFEKEYRVLAPTIPQGVNKLEEIVESIRKLILKINKQSSPVILLGISFGGIISQIFLHKYPKMINSIILSHTGTPQYWKQKRFSIMKNIYLMLPYSIIKILAKKLAIKKEEISTSKWIAANSQYFTELAENYLTKELFLSRIQAILDFKNYELNSNLIKEWKGNVLILASEDDRLIDQISLLKLYYKDANIHIFPKGKGGHHTNLYFPEEYNKIVKIFLEEKNLKKTKKV